MVQMLISSACTTGKKLTTFVYNTRVSFNATNITKELHMNTKLFKLSSLSILILTGVLFLAACQGVGGAPVVLAQPDYVLAAPDAAFDYQKSADNQAARWVAMGEFYQQNDLLTRKLDAGDISAQRWQAMASFYEYNPQVAALYQQALAAPLTSVNAADAAALRWTAMGEFYQENDLLTRALDSGDISAMRWQAMAQFYADQGLLTR